MANRNSKLFCELEKESIERIIVRYFPDEKITAYSLCDGGLFNTTYRVACSDRTFILRVAPTHSELLMDYEHDMMKTEEYIFGMMKKAGIPTSDVLVCDTSREIIDRDFMIVDCIDAVALSCSQVEPLDRAEIQVKVGEVLAKMHSVTVKGFGRATDVLSGKSFPNFFDSIYDEVSRLCAATKRDGFYTEAECGYIIDTLKKHEGVLASETMPHLCHGDMWDGNILVKKENGHMRLAAVIDADRAYFGDIAFDLGNPWIINDDFLRGYGITREALEMREFRIKRKTAALVYFMIEAYVWNSQYNVRSNAESGKKNVFEICEQLRQL